MYDLFIKNGNVFLNNEIKKCNIAIKNSKILNITDVDNVDSKTIIDVENKYVVPGFIDVHFHVRSPSYPERGTVESETKAAAAGGIAAVFEMPISKPCCSTLERFENRKKHFYGKSFVNYGIYAAPGTSYKQKGKNYNEVFEIDKEKIINFKKSGAIAFKIFMINPPKGREDEFEGLSIVDRGHLLHTLQLIKKSNLVTTIHAESEDLLNHYSYTTPKHLLKSPETHNLLRPKIVETSAINDILFLNREINTKIHIAHLSSKTGLELITYYKNLGVDVTVETCPHYLFYNKNVLKKYGNFAKINPPIRDTEDKESLWKGLLKDNIDIIASDHAAFCYNEKIVRNDIDKVPPGHPGVNSLIYSLLNEVSEKKISLSELIKFCSVNPAKRFNIFPKYGNLSKAGLANITVIDLNKKYKYTTENQFSKAKNSDVLYSNKEFNGKIDYTIINGKIVYDGNTIIKKKYGKFINPNNK